MAKYLIGVFLTNLQTECEPVPRFFSGLIYSESQGKDRLN